MFCLITGGVLCGAGSFHLKKNTNKMWNNITLIPFYVPGLNFLVLGGKDKFQKEIRRVVCHPCAAYSAAFMDICFKCD